MATFVVKRAVFVAAESWHTARRAPSNPEYSIFTGAS